MGIISIIIIIIMAIIIIIIIIIIIWYFSCAAADCDLLFTTGCVISQRKTRNAEYWVMRSYSHTIHAHSHDGHVAFSLEALTSE